MQERFIKRIVKSWIDNSNWSYQAKRELKFIVDVSRTADEMVVGFVLYPYWIHNC